MLDDIVEQRIKKLEELRAAGIEPYSTGFKPSASISSVLKDFKETDVVSCAGRVMSLRGHGKSIFGDLKDQSGKIQIYVKSDILGEARFPVFRKLDIGDIVGMKGELFRTRTGEPTILIKEFQLLAKAIRPLPEKWHGLKDVEIRYRKRYLDLLVNDDVKSVFVTRSRVIKSIRNFFDEQGFLEVETPMMHQIAGGAAGKPFQTYLEALDLDLFLRIAPELYLKRLLVGGLEKVYEINRSFRNEGLSVRHNPEFTMLEVYMAYADFTDMMRLVKGIVLRAADEVLGKRQIEFKGQKIDLENWETVSFARMMEDNYGVRPQDTAEEWLKKLSQKGIKVELKDGKISRTFILNLVSDLLEVKAEHPVFVTDMFTELCPLARKKADEPLLSERFELFIGGMEVANAYSELNDPGEQRQRFQEQACEEGGKVDEAYVEALEYGMPPAGGLGMGIDRLIMLLTGRHSIKDVILFPQLKPETETVDEEVCSGL